MKKKRGRKRIEKNTSITTDPTTTFLFHFAVLLHVTLGNFKISVTLGCHNKTFCTFTVATSNVDQAAEFLIEFKVPLLKENLVNRSLEVIGIYSGFSFVYIVDVLALSKRKDPHIPQSDTAPPPQL